MEPLQQTIRSMIAIADQEMDQLLEKCFLKIIPKKAIISTPHRIPEEVYFIQKGILRVVITDRSGTEHTIHFAQENDFIADYANFLQKRPSHYTLQALETLEIVVMPRAAIDFGYMSLKEGDKLGRLIAEGYFIYHDNRIRDMYFKSPKERYDTINDVFPNIHNRVPQHMIASYLGITPIHLSRLKKQALLKI